MARRGEKEWEDSFYSMEEKYRALQKRLNDKENELKLTKVKNLKDELKGPRPVARVSTSFSGASPTMEKSKSPLHKAPMRLSPGQLSRVPPPQPPAPKRVSTASSPHNHRPQSPINASRKPSFDEWLDAGNDEPVDSGGRWFNNHEVTRLPVNNQYDPPPPVRSADHLDPLMMVWGSGNTDERLTALSASNEKLRQLTEDANERMKLLEHERAQLRKANDDLTKQHEETKAEVHQLLRERDLAVQKLRNAEHCIANLESNNKVLSDDKESMRFALEAQLRDLRSRLVSAADSNNDITADVRTLLSELKESNGRASTHQSKCALLETSHATQLNTNRSLVAELDSVTQQLANERRKVLTLARDVHVSAMHKDRVEDLERRLQLSQQEKAALESEHVKLMDNLIVASQRADASARQTVKDEVGKLIESSSYFERASKLLYRDVQQLTESHNLCRSECSEAKERRDQAETSLKAARQDIQLLQAKLQIVWPTHTFDTAGYADHRAITTAYDRMKQRRATECSATDRSLFLDIPLEDQVRELQQANSIHVAELEALRIANQLLSDKLLDTQGACDDVRNDAKRARSAADQQESAAHRQVLAQSERIAFLEEQVSLMRGVRVGDDTSLVDLAPGEVLIEVFVGQLLSAKQVGGDEIPLAFVTADFLIHETITSNVVAGQSGFLDMSATFKVQADSLLIYYLCSRGLRVQLHVVQGGGGGGAPESYHTIGEGVVSLLDLIADEDILLSPRPTLRGQVKLVGGDSQSLGAVEYAITVRTPFTAKFVQQCRSELPRQEPGMSQIRAAHECSLLSTNIVSLDIAEMVETVILQISQLQIRHEVNDVPLLSLFLSIPSLGLMEHHLPPPSTSSRYQVDFPHTDQYTIRLPVIETRALVRALAEPVAVFAFREDENLALDGSVVSESSSSSTIVQHWGISLLHWGSVADSAAVGEWTEQKADMLGPDGRHVAVLTVNIKLESK